MSERHEGAANGHPAVGAIDWDDLDGQRRALTPTRIAFASSVAGWLTLWGYDALVTPTRAALVWGRSPTNVDWLFGLTLLVLGFTVVLPLARTPRLARYYWRQFRRNRAAVISLAFLAVIFVVGLVGPYVIGRPELDFAVASQPPVGFGGSWEHPLGTHRTGEDILAITVAGMRVSMQVGLIATTVSIALATATGATAALVGGWVDEVLMRFVDLLLTFPTFFLILFLVYIYGGDLFLLILILSLTGWGGAARLIRSEALQRTEEPYVRAARSAGASRLRIVRHHVVPNVSNTVITAATLAVPTLILFEAVIAFLGFGDPDVWSWGRIIADGRDELRTAWWISTIPGLFLFATVMAFNFVGDALRDALDPRHEVGDAGARGQRSEPGEERRKGDGTGETGDGGGGWR